MAKDNKKTKDQSLVDYVVNLRRTNDKVTTKPPKANIEDILQDPVGYAKDYVEIALAKHVKDFKKSFEAGRKFAKELEK